MCTKEKLLMGELIGKKTTITKSSDKSQIGKTGEIIDETLNTVTIEEKSGKTTKITKKQATFAFNEITIEGKEINFRPEDRIKKYWRKFDGQMRRQKLSKTRNP